MKKEVIKQVHAEGCALTRAIIEFKAWLRGYAKGIEEMRATIWKSYCAENGKTQKELKSNEFVTETAKLSVALAIMKRLNEVLNDNGQDFDELFEEQETDEV